MSNISQIFYYVCIDNDTSMNVSIRLLERAGLLPQRVAIGGVEVELSLADVKAAKLFNKRNILRQYESAGVELTCCTSEECLYKVSAADIEEIFSGEKDIYERFKSGDDGVDVDKIFCEVKEEALAQYFFNEDKELRLDVNADKTLTIDGDCLDVRELTNNVHPDVLLHALNRVIGFRFVDKPTDDEEEDDY